MRSLRCVILLALVALLVAACSSSGKSGVGDGMGEGSIPIATAGTDLRDVHFAYDSSSLSRQAQAMLRQNAKWLNSNSDVKVVAEGHCDERGTNEYNLALGERRARSVYDYLRSLGVKSDQMSTVSYGEELPLDTRSNESAWAKNRRAHFAVK